MTNDGRYTGVVDRFEGELAVVLLEEEGKTVDEVVLDKSRLPEEGHHVDAVLSVQLEDGDVVDLTYEEQETENRSDRAQDRFDELSQRPPSAEDNSNSESR